MNPVVLTLAQKVTGDRHLVVEKMVLCERHVTNQRNIIRLVGFSDDDCYHCSIEWSKSWQALLTSNHWLGEINDASIAYISGPMTGYQDFNRPAFHMMEHALRLRGAQVLSPARHPAGMAYEDYMRLDIAMITKANVMVMLTGWRSSQGASMERKIAKFLKIKIYEQRSKPASP